MMATICKEPSQTDLQKTPILQEMQSKMKSFGDLVNRNEWEKHGKTCSEGIGCLNWVLIRPCPLDFIENFIGGSDYWANGIRKEFKGVDDKQIAFCDTFKALITGLMAYVKEYHRTGVTWNPKGTVCSDYPATAGSAQDTAAPTAQGSATPAAGSATPTAEGFATPAESSAPTTSSAPSAGIDLFAAINKGGSITSGLKTVTKDMQTWRAEYAGEDAPKVTQAPREAPKKKEIVLAHPPRKEFNEATQRWNIDYQTAKEGLVDINITDKKQTVYILGCVGASISIKGKCKSIILDSCKQVSLSFDVAMASVEVVNSSRVKIFCRDNVNAVAIDKTDGIVVTLPTTSMHTEVVASKSSEMNLAWTDESGEMVERPIPEQFVHRIKDMKITANVSDLYSS